MADHIRKQIRDAAETALTGLTTTGASVFPSRTRPLDADELPGLRVYCKDEPEIRIAAVGAGLNRVRLERHVELVVEACSKKVSATDDQADAMIKEVEIAIAGVQTLGGAKRAHLTRIETDFEGDGEHEIAVARMVFDVLYFTVLNAPDVAI